MSANFGWNPAPTAGTIVCKACQVRKPREAFPQTELRVGCTCKACICSRITADVLHLTKEEALGG